MCLTVRLAFLVQMFNLSKISALLTTYFCMEICVLNERHFSAGKIEFIKKAQTFD
jgi:hypothetical protein